MTEVNIGQVSSSVTVQETSRPIEQPAEDGPEAVERLESLRARAQRWAERTQADGFLD